jgi:hypothetical protein
MSDTQSGTQTVINTRPQYVQDIDQALLARIFGTPDESGVLTGGLIDDPTLFNIPDYVQGKDASGMQAAVAATLGTPEARQEFLDRYSPYFFTEDGTPRYLPDAASALGTGETSIAKALTDYFPSAKTYLESGTGAADIGTIYDDALQGVAGKIDQGTQTFDAQQRANALLGGAKTAIQGGLGQYGVDADALRKGTGTYDINEAQFDEGRGLVRGALGEYQQTGGLGKARDAVTAAGQGEFGAREAFERGTGRAFELAEQGLGSFDPSSAAQAFMDPYKEQVIDAAMDRINREGAKRRQAGAAQAIGAGAFGGSRAGVQAAETERAIEETKQQTVANLMSQGYDKAMANAMATDEAARKRALQASGLTGELGTKGATLEQQAYTDAASRGLAAATTSAGLSQVEEQMRQKAYEDAQARGLQGAALLDDVAKTMNQLGMSAYESGAARTQRGEQFLSQEERAAYEDAMKRQLAAGQQLGALGTTQLGAESTAFESGEDRMLKAADMYRSIGLSEADATAKAKEDEYKRNLEAGRLMGGLGQTYGQLGGAQADIGQAYGQLAGTSADIGRVYAGIAPADLGFMYELGGKERMYDQQYQDFQRANTLADTQQALAPYSYGQTFLTQSPSASMYSEYTQTPQTQANPFLQGVGMYTTMQGLNQ